MPRTTYKAESDKIRKWGEIEDIMKSIRDEFGDESINYTPISYNGARYVVAERGTLYVFKQGADGKYSLIGGTERAEVVAEFRKNRKTAPWSPKELNLPASRRPLMAAVPDVAPETVPKEKKWGVRRRDPVESFGPGFFIHGGDEEETVEEVDDAPHEPTVFEYKDI